MPEPPIVFIAGQERPQLADRALQRRTIIACQGLLPFGNELLFAASNLPLFRFHAEICEDLWVPIPPSAAAALAGATMLVNLSASNVTVGKDAVGRLPAAPGPLTADAAARLRARIMDAVGTA